MKAIVVSGKVTRKAVGDIAMATALPLLQLLVGALLTACALQVPLPRGLWLLPLLTGVGLLATGSSALIRECWPFLRPYEAPRLRRSVY